MTAVADHQTLGEAQAASFIANPVEINAGHKQIRASVAHDARDQERRFSRDVIRSICSDQREANNVAVTLTLVDICSSQRGNPVL